jgi:uncharacterized membrane protein YjgN (DUF898 family)
MDQTPVQTSSPSETSDVNRLRFHGSASEYFRIWIVNLVLTIVTLGIYSAWAKVRTKKYLYGNIELAGSRFDYHADPIKILKGRILVGALFFCYAVGGKISPYIAGVFVFIFWGVYPWILVRALMFALSNTSYRGIRFGFEKNYKDSYAAFFKGLFVTIISFGLACPYAIRLHMYFSFNHSRFGNQKFKFEAPQGYFFKIFYAYIGIALVGMPFMIGLLILKKPLAIGVGVICMYAGFIFAGAYFRTRILNLMANQTTLGPVQLRSKLQVPEMAGLYFTNLLGCIFSLGLAIPWAIIRSYRYRIENTQVIAQANAIETFQADVQAGSQFAAADAAVDFWDVDLGF